ncbi:MAG: class I tRNA ligase family protein, partial [Chloroflexota bacterium]
LEAFDLGEAEREIHDFLWGEYCDWYIELAKLRLRRGENPLPVLVNVLETSLKLLHPYMPFITEEIYHHLSPHLEKPAEALIIAPYPGRGEGRDIAAEREMGLVIEVIRALRRVRTELRIEPQLWLEAQVYTQDQLDLNPHRESIEALGRSRPLELRPWQEKPTSLHGHIQVLDGAEVVLPLTEINREKERQRLEKERQELLQVMAGWQRRWENPDFRQHAPDEVVKDIEQKVTSARERLGRLEALLSSLG